jgi:hypothetical protein
MYWVDDIDGNPEFGIDAETGDIIWTPRGIKVWSPLLCAHGISIARVTNLRQFGPVFSEENARRADACVDRVRAKANTHSADSVYANALLQILTTGKPYASVKHDLDVDLRRHAMHLVT